MRASAILVASGQGPKLQKIIETNINQESLRVDLWRNDTQLFSQLSEQAYALLVIDLDLLVQVSPADSFFARLRTASPNTAVLLLSNPDERKQAIEQLQQGAADHLFFPIDASELSLKIERVLELQAIKHSPARPARLDAAADELLLLHEASQEINHTLELDEVLKIVLSRAEHITGAELVRIYLADRNDTLGQSEAVAKKSPLLARTKENDLLFRLAQKAALAQEIMGYHKTSAPEWQNQPLQSALLIPIVSRDKLMGVLALGSQHSSAFSDNQVRWLSVFCDRAATAIENARLFQDLSSAYIDLAQSREQILHSRNTLQVLFDGITDDLYLVDQSLAVSALNREDNVEQQPDQADESTGPNNLSLAWSKAAPELLNQIRESLQTGRETTWIPSENETEPYFKDREFRIYPIRNRLGQTEQVIVFAQDVSERRRLQASLFRSANLVAVGQLAGSVAHQINNPLTIAMANSQIILLEAKPKSDTYELAQSIFKASARIQSIVENLLEFSNQETYFFVETDLINTIEGALALVIRSLKKFKIKVIKDYQARPKLSASISHLKLVWMNLLLNARDAVIDCADQPQITISTRMVSDRAVKVTITDNGRGIAEKDFEQLFRPFFTTKPVGKALGLGLYAAHNIVEHHHGQIKTSSQPGVATTFEVILPLDNPRDL
jgi:two-component system NtrC family sensor kinase